KTEKALRAESKRRKAEIKAQQQQERAQEQEELQEEMANNNNNNNNNRSVKDHAYPNIGDFMPTIRSTIDASSGGDLMEKSEDEAFSALDKIAYNNYQWSCERNEIKKPAGMFELDAMNMINAKKLVEEKGSKERESKEEEPKYVAPKAYMPPLPFPQRFEAKLDKQFGKFLEVLKSLHVTIPFTDALAQMPSYAKFLKEILSNKKKLEEFETKMKIGEMKSTTISLQLADRSIKFPIGIVENVPLKDDVHIPIILGRPFLATAGAVIDVKNGRLKLEVGEEKVEFNLFQAMKKKDDSNSCLRVDVIDEEVREVLKKQHPKDPLEACLVHNIKKGDEIEEQETTSSSKLEKSEAPKVELKPLPTNLRYAFLGQNSTYPVIVSAKLTDCEVEKLLRVLRKHRRIIGYTIDDIKGIHPSVCMHRILLENDHKASRESQRRLNPNMKEVVKKRS
ncbi:hypothetical protein P3X46_034882, partial [Hevea brasiliensis]